MKIESTSINLKGTVAEFRRVADTLLLVDRSTSRYIADDLWKTDEYGTAIRDDEMPVPLEDGKVISISFGTRSSTESVLKAIRELGIIVEERTEAIRP